MDNTTCRKCGGQMQDGLALKEIKEPRMGVPDFPDNTIDSIGQTFHFETVGSKMIDVLKCEACGHSVTKDTRGIMSDA